MKLVVPERALTGLEEKIFTLIVIKLQGYYCRKKYTNKCMRINSEGRIQLCPFRIPWDVGDGYECSLCVSHKVVSSNQL
jgi:hypothetical protein